MRGEMNSALESAVYCVHAVGCHDHDAAVILEQSALIQLEWRLGIEQRKSTNLKKTLILVP